MKKNRHKKKLKTGLRAGTRSPDYEQEATSVETPNIVITLAESH